MSFVQGVVSEGDVEQLRAAGFQVEDMGLFAGDPVVRVQLDMSPMGAFEPPLCSECGAVMKAEVGPPKAPVVKSILVWKCGGCGAGVKHIAFRPGCYPCKELKEALGIS